MATTNRSERVRFRYGICLNDGCPKCKSKEVQEIAARKDFICAECGKPLRECPPPRSWWQKHGKKVMAGAAAIIVAGGGIAMFTLGGGESGSDDNDNITVNADTLSADSLLTDTVAKVQPAAEYPKAAEPDEVKTEPKKASPAGETNKTGKTSVGHAPGERWQGTLNLGYGTYSGEIVDGRPDGTGVLRYTSSQRVVSTKDVMAESGERIEGVFENGKPSFVTLYKKDGNTVKIHR